MSLTVDEALRFADQQYTKQSFAGVLAAAVRRMSAENAELRGQVAPAVPYGIDEEAANRIALAVYDCKNGINPEPLLYVINRILAAEAHPLSVEGKRALLQSAEVTK